MVMRKESNQLYRVQSDTETKIITHSSEREGISIGFVGSFCFSRIRTEGFS